jgi:tRNA dimethylallyltransferase
MSALAAYFLVGPTASGKSAVALQIAQESRPPQPILAADSMTVYRGMDIGTAKPDPAERAMVPSFGFDLVDPDRPFLSATISPPSAPPRRPSPPAAPHPSSRAAPVST